MMLKGGQKNEMGSRFAKPCWLLGSETRSGKVGRQSSSVLQARTVPNR